MANQDLWERLLDLSRIHQVVGYWVKSHADYPRTLRVDCLVVAAAKTQ